MVGQVPAAGLGTITKLCKIGQEEVSGVLAADVIIVMISAGKGKELPWEQERKFIYTPHQMN